MYIKNPNDKRSVTIDPQQTYSSNGYILKVTDKNGNITIGADSNGNAEFSGKITSTSGNIGNFKISNEGLSSQNGSTKIWYNAVYTDFIGPSPTTSSTSFTVGSSTINETFISGKSKISLMPNGDSSSGTIVLGGTVYTPDGTVSRSDKDTKNTISPLSIEQCANFTYSLIPSQFKYNYGTSNRLHHGFIAQDVKKSMGENDWGVYVDSNSEEKGNKGLRYEELIADIVGTVQYQKQIIDKQQKEIDILKEQVSFLMQK